MTDLVELVNAQPTQTLADGEVLISQGETGGDLFILVSGHLVVARDGIAIAVLSRPGTIVGEMSVLLGLPHTATVRAENETKVQVIRDARRHLQSEPQLTFRVAMLLAGRLEATSALVVELSQQPPAKTADQGLIKRLFSALAAPDT